LTTKRGAEFGELQRCTARGLDNELVRLSPFTFSSLDNGSPSRSFGAPGGLDLFRLGQHIHFWIGIANPIQLIGDDTATANWTTRLQLKPWWLRPNLEYRAAGFPTWTGLDTATFLSGQNFDNKYVWIPSPKRLDVTQYQTPPPTASPARHSDSLMEDDVWTFDLQDPNDVDYQDDFPPPQIVSRWDNIWYPAHGYSVAFTWTADTAFVPGPDRSSPFFYLSLTYTVGTLGGSFYGESLG
jgi:hypothetical protein